MLLTLGKVAAFPPSSPPRPRVCEGRAGQPRSPWPPQSPFTGTAPAGPGPAAPPGRPIGGRRLPVRPLPACLRAARRLPGVAGTATGTAGEGDGEQLRSGAVREPNVLGKREAMLMLDCSSESGSSSNLLEAGTGVNAPADAFGQSPAHLAACGGEAFFLLWQLQTGANLNQQDCLGEAPIHKAAKVGSLECLALLVAGDAKIDLCNNSGQTAADLALAYGFLDCAKFLTTVQHTQTMKLRGQSACSLSDKRGLLREDPAGQKQEFGTNRSISRKRRRPDGPAAKDVFEEIHSAQDTWLYQT
ncbi:ankyrin repeat domain-containing protein 37 [Heliangelus exortis]|uniref:ankyrin repeat domain-containing protein 37 n=1 Tax=Heliangelus exortis TaxID=472823 RepID=UPI003A8DA9E7